MNNTLNELLGKPETSNALLWKYCPEHRLSLHLDEDFPYFENDNGEYVYRPEYLKSCLQIAENVYDDLCFGNDLLVVYEDIYSCAEKGEKKIIESCFGEILSQETIKFNWHFDEDSDTPPNLRDDKTYIGRRHIFRGKNLNTSKLFTKIILSDIADNTDFSSAVYIIDIRSKNVFWLYDDRGLDVFSSDIKKLEPLSKKYENLLLEII